MTEPDEVQRHQRDVPTILGQHHRPDIHRVVHAVGGALRPEATDPHRVELPITVGAVPAVAAVRVVHAAAEEAVAVIVRPGLRHQRGQVDGRGASVGQSVYSCGNPQGRAHIEVRAGLGVISRAARLDQPPQSSHLRLPSRHDARCLYRLPAPSAGTPRATRVAATRTMCTPASTRAPEPAPSDPPHRAAPEPPVQSRRGAWRCCGWGCCVPSGTEPRPARARRLGLRDATAPSSTDSSAAPSGARPVPRRQRRRHPHPTVSGGSPRSCP